MSKLLLHVHAHRPFPFHKADWLKLVCNVGDDVPGAEKLADRLPGVPLQGWNSLLALSDADADYVGFIGYRRYPMFSSQIRCPHFKVHMEPTPETMRLLASREQAQAALNILASHDVIQFRPFPLNMNVREQFAQFNPPQLWDIMVDELNSLGLGQSLGYFEHNNAHVWNGLMVTKKSVMDDFAAFTANLCRKLLAREDYQKIAEKPFLSPNGVKHNFIEVCPEYAAPLWVFHHRLRSAFVPLVALDPAI